MPYITREDGEHFVIPSYRDVLSTKQKATLKKEILGLSNSYGEYITLQQKNATQWEVAFSPDTGYLLGESIWHQFQKPDEMIYCEAIPATNEVLLVIVKAGSVYLDGSFPQESIPDELIIFLTQQNHFEIYTYGDVPISKTPEEGKFCFEESSVKSFTVLEKPVFPTLPLLKNYRLQLVDPVLRAQGIGVFPVKQFVIILVVVVIILFAFFHTSEETVAPETTEAQQVNPYQQYYDLLSTPAPDEELRHFVTSMENLSTLPGWSAHEVTYSKGGYSATISSDGGSVEALVEWTKKNNASYSIFAKGIALSGESEASTVRPRPKQIYAVKDVIGHFIDAFAYIYHGNLISSVSDISALDSARKIQLTLTFDNVSPIFLNLVSQQLKDMPVNLIDVKVVISDGKMNGTITLDVLGS